MPPPPCQHKDHIIHKPSCERRQVQSHPIPKRTTPFISQVLRSGLLLAQQINLLNFCLRGRRASLACHELGLNQRFPDGISTLLIVTLVTRFDTGCLRPGPFERTQVAVGLSSQFRFCSKQKDLSEIAGWVGKTKKDMGLFGHYSSEEHSFRSCTQYIEHQAHLDKKTSTSNHISFGP
ncbi:hypothetical protein SLEP1_g58318 [Rubroshorea leprosula]|uniref:Uncharacterized protein n=1 Tax=Rubroshorea leprosula TaxID=152421 RepID=A0AAV5MTH2_9ROSI|nr:hypothetical protein SLEP1_g58318 [Rubroshorea leprosula]